MGFILNKKTELTINMLFPELEHLPETPIYLGGPVASNRLFFVHSLGNAVIPNSFPINDHLYFDGDFDALRDYMLSEHNFADKVKFFIGYSGWGKGQLKDEIKANSWAVVQALDSISERPVLELITFYLALIRCKTKTSLYPSVVCSQSLRVP